MAPETKHKEFGEILRQRALEYIDEVIMVERFSALFEELQAQIQQLDGEKKEDLRERERLLSLVKHLCEERDQALQEGEAE